jgi:hypothetical protein
MSVKQTVLQYNVGTHHTKPENQRSAVVENSIDGKHHSDFDIIEAPESIKPNVTPLSGEPLK